MKGTQFLLIACFVFCVVFVGKHYTKELKRKYTNKSSYKPLEQVSEEKPFVVVIPSFNNEKYVEDNLKSVFEQEYQNYRVIYIDDASLDNTYYKAAECVSAYNKEDQVILIQNEKNQKALYNIYYAVQSARNEEIIVILDGDDRLSHNQVFKELNRYYNDENVWMTYGQYITYPGFEKGMCRETFFQALKRGKVRKPGFFVDETEWIFSHLRTFYAGLFKRILLKDLLYQGEFYPSAGDVATMFPMLEMAREHAVFIPKVLYIYNRETPLNDDKLRMDEQVSLNHYIRGRKSYPPLKEHPKKEIVYEANSALVLFSSDRSMQLYGFLESLEKYAKGFRDITVFYTASDPVFEEGYTILKKAFPRYTYHPFNPSKKELMRLLEEKKCDYVTLTDDRRLLKDYLSFTDAMREMEKVGAEAFYLQLGLNLSKLPARLLPIGGGVFAWEIKENAWKEGDLFDMTLYKKENILALLHEENFHSLSDLTNKPRVGFRGEIALCYKESKVVVTPMQMTKVDTGDEISLYTPMELNDRLLEGYKLDISPLFQIENKAEKITYYPRFIERPAEL